MKSKNVLTTEQKLVEAYDLPDNWTASVSNLIILSASLGLISAWGQPSRGVFSFRFEDREDLLMYDEEGAVKELSARLLDHIEETKKIFEPVVLADVDDDGVDYGDDEDEDLEGDPLI